MTGERKVYRTAGYRVMKDGAEHIMLWCLTPSGLDPAKVWVTEYDLYGIHVSSRPLGGQMTEREALRRLAEIEKDAVERYRAAGDDFLGWQSTGDRLRNALPWQEHPLHHEEKLEALRSLRSKRPGAKFKL